jgi:WD40 repeat protein/DNA-directed RNA polymerase subunit RPC12/RpoP
VGTLRLLESNSGERHEGEVFACAYSSDGAFVLSGGWDGILRLWDATTGESRVAVSASPKPLSCCTCSPDGLRWLAGSMEGILGIWDAVSQQPLQTFVAHTRPISSIAFAPDGQSLVTTGWDRQIIVRKVGNEREGRTLGTHDDIVAGCCFTLDGKQLISWSYDGKVKLWDLQMSRELATFVGHTDRIVCAALSPDGRYLLSGGRDATVRLWDLEQLNEAATVNLGAEVRSCFYLLDGESVVVADAVGRLFLMGMPTFQVQAQLQTPFKIICGALSPSGEQLVVGSEDGLVHFVALEGFESASLIVTATQNVKQEAGLLDRFFGKTRIKRTYSYTCPACRQSVEASALPTQPVPCPRCQRRLRVNSRTPQLQGS